MTNEEMAAKLAQAGWRVQPPLTKENCKHPLKQGTGMIGSDGASKMTWYCPDCHASYEFESPAIQHMPKQPEFWR